MVRFNINGLPVEDVKISESDIGKVFTFGKRNYQVLSIDIENKSLEVEKKISGGNESTKQTLRLEN